MPLRPKDPLLTIGRILVLIMQALIAIAIAVLVIVIPVVLFNEGRIIAELVAENPGVDFTFPTGALVLVMLLAVAALGMVFVFFQRLRQIIATVGDGDPFVPENAQRLSLMAWLMLGANIVSIPIAALALHVADELQDVHEETFAFDTGFDFGGILLIITLFILSRVFRQGAAMREDLEGTV